MSGIEFYSAPQHGEMGVEEWGKLMARFPNHAERAIASALKSEGKRVQQLIKHSIIRGGPDGARWTPLHPHNAAIYRAKRSHVKKVGKMSKGIKPRQTKWEWLVKDARHIEAVEGRFPLQKTAASVRYTYSDNIRTVTIGYLDTKKRKLAELNASGYRIQVTPRMRRLAFAVGFPLAMGMSTLNVPARPVIAPVFRAEEKKMKANVQEKSLRSIYRYLTGKSKEQMDKEWIIE